MLELHLMMIERNLEARVVKDERLALQRFTMGQDMYFENVDSHTAYSLHY